MEKDHGTTLKPNQESLSFMDELYAEYLPNFRSLQFNVGMDDPGNSVRDGVGKKSFKRKGKVYLKHLEGIRSLVEKHGRKMQFWADVLLEEPENARLLPASASPIIWGYEADHPFDEQAEIVSSVTPFVWLGNRRRSFSGRWPVSQVTSGPPFETLDHSAEGSFSQLGRLWKPSTLGNSLSAAFSGSLCWAGSPPDEQTLIRSVDQWAFSARVVS